MPASDIHEWLKAKYCLASEKRYVISAKALQAFKTNYLDFYHTLKEDFGKTKSALAMGNGTDNIDLALQSSPAYKDALMTVLNQEIDLKQTISRLCVAVETRLGQMYDLVQDEFRNDPRNVNFKLDRVLQGYIEQFVPLLEKANKIINEAPDQIVQHNVTVQHIDSTIGVFYEAIRQTLAQMDMESSMLFMELFNAKLNALKDPALSPPDRLQEVKALNGVINDRLNDLKPEVVLRG